MAAIERRHAADVFVGEVLVGYTVVAVVNRSVAW